MSGEKAFTLLELLVVLVVLTISTAIVFPKLEACLPRESLLWRSGKRLASVAKYAREVSICTQSMHLLHVDRQAGTYWVATRTVDGELTPPANGLGLSGQLPDGVRFGTIELPGGDSLSEAVVVIRFSPEGWCDPAIVSIVSSDGLMVRVRINEWPAGTGLSGADLVE